MALKRLILALAVLLSAPAFAEGEAVQAKRLFVSGSKHFDLGEYREALNDFKEGYRLKDDPVFLYNIAQCHRLLNENKEAIQIYRSYLNRSPSAPNRVEVERKIASLQAAVESQEKAATTPPNQVIPPETKPVQPGPSTTPATVEPSTTATTVTARPARTPVYKKWWLWTAVGGVVAIGLGVGLGVGLSQSSSSGPTVFPTVMF